MRTEVKNRIHALLDKHGLKCPFETLFIKKGIRWLRNLRLGFTDDAVLSSLPALLEALDTQIEFMEAKIAAVAVNDERDRLLVTMPGLGYFAAVLWRRTVNQLECFELSQGVVVMETRRWPRVHSKWFLCTKIHHDKRFRP